MNSVVFGIPLVSRRVARDWDSVERLLSNTLQSALAQEGAEIKIIIVCHEVPNIKELSDPRVRVAQADFDIPRFRWEMEIDRMRKLETIGTLLRAEGGGLLFTLDADDYVSKWLAIKIIESPTKATMIGRGYRLDVRENKYQMVKKFWGKCGSCAAVRWEVHELPKKALADNPTVYHEFCETRHYSLPVFFKRIGASLSFIEEPLVTYVMNHGSNQSDIITKDSIKWAIYFKILRWKKWTATFDSEFNVRKLERHASIYSGSKLFSTQFKEREE